MTEFWTAALDLTPEPPRPGDDFRVLRGEGINLSLQVAATPVTARDQMHLDLYSDDQAAEVARLIGLGARFVRHSHEGETTTTSCWPIPKATSSASAPWRRCERSGAVDAGEGRVGRPHAFDGPGEAAVHAHLHHDLAHLVAAQAVVQRRGDVELELVVLAQPGEDGDHHEAAVAPGELRSRPHLAEGPVERQLAHVAEAADDVGQRLRRVATRPGPR